MIYNVAFMIYKEVNSYTNLTKEEFFDKLWEWTYEDDLWDFIEEDKPDEEYLDYFICNIFIDQNIFHEYEEDELDCFAFKVDDDGIVHVYNWNQPLVDFVMKKVKEHYEK